MWIFFNNKDICLKNNTAELHFVLRIHELFLKFLNTLQMALIFIAFETGNGTSPHLLLEIVNLLEVFLIQLENIIF